jgi:hypothetical protein
MRVELLYWDGDPHYMTARQRLVEVLTEDAFETPIQMIAVNSDADAELLEFPGSPTIRIDGIDIHPAGVGEIGLRLRGSPASGSSAGGWSARADGAMGGRHRPASASARWSLDSDGTMVART